MRKTHLLLILLLLTSCTTMNESLQLGASLGTLFGAGAAYAGKASAGGSASFGDAALGAGIGMGVGLITSYLVHHSVESDRTTCEAEQTEMHFGDLPPSPFVVPKMKIKKGVN